MRTVRGGLWMSRKTRVSLISACTAAMWVFPSFGTQGMGTLRRASTHVDRNLVAGNDAGSAAEQLLLTMDRRVAAVVIAPER